MRLQDRFQSSLYSRRSFVKNGALASGGLVFLGASPGSLARASQPQPHFLLHLVFAEGWSPTYWFDARPRSFTAAGLWENYHGPASEIPIWTDRRGRTSWVSPSMAALKGDFETTPCFSVVRGLHGSPEFDGHGENLRLLLSGSTSGGAYLGVPINQAARGRERGTALDYLTTGPTLFGANFSGGTELGLSVDLVRALKAMAAESAAATLPASEAMRLTQSLFQRAGESRGLGGQGARHYSAAAQESEGLRHTLSRLNVDTLEAGQGTLPSVALALRAFAAGLGHVALVNVPNNYTLASGGTFSPDTHGNVGAAQQPEGYALAAQEMAGVIKLLRETAFDEASGQSFLDVTTVVVTSEFGRTNRQLGANIDNTGTNHNRFGNMALVGGKGIEPGLFVGSTDLDQLITTQEGVAAFAAPSRAHQSMDPSLLMAMGHVYDFTLGRVDAAARPEQYRMADYLTVGSLVNTIYRLFDVPESAWRAQQGLGGAQGARFPVIRELLKAL